MRIYIQALMGESIPIEAEGFHTIDHVKQLIEEKEGTDRLDQRLIFAGEVLEDFRTLADCRIQNHSVIHLTRIIRGGMHLHINTFSGYTFTMGVWSLDTINNLKAHIHERMCIPVSEQRLLLYGKELDDGARTLADYRILIGTTLNLVRRQRDGGDDAVGNSGVLAIRKKTPSGGLGIGNLAEAVIKQPEVGLKRAREDASSRGLSLCGVNYEEGVESFWDEEDFGLAWRRSRSLISPYDTSRFKTKSQHTLIESVANDCVRTLNVMAFLESKLQENKDRLSEAEKEVKRLTEKNALTNDSLQKEKDKCKKLLLELDEERSTGNSFLQSEAGRRHKMSLVRQAAKSAIDEFKNNASMKAAAMSVYDNAVKDCQRLLRESGRVSEDIIQLLDPQDPNQEETEVVDDEEVEEEYMDVKG